MAAQSADATTARPGPALRGLVGGYHGSRIAGLPPGRHLGLPAPHLGLIIALGDPVHLGVMPDPTRPPGSFRALVHGLQTRPAVIAHDGSSYTLSVDLTPAGCRALFGVPAAALAGAVVGLDDLLGRFADGLAERLAAAPGWPARFAVLDEVLAGLAARSAGAAPDAVAAGAWRRLVDAGGRLTVAELAAGTGYTRPYLTRRFVREHGLTPKQVARVVRFARSHRLLRDLGRARLRQDRPDRPGRPGRSEGHRTLAEVAAACGYYDQAHLSREWGELAGCPPSAWLAAERLPFVERAAGPSAP
jgi:AraC-like DNA-binding protein